MSYMELKLFWSLFFFRLYRNTGDFHILIVYYSLGTSFISSSDVLLTCLVALATACSGVLSKCSFFLVVADKHSLWPLNMTVGTGQWIYLSGLHFLFILSVIWFQYSMLVAIKRRCGGNSLVSKGILTSECGEPHSHVNKPNLMLRCRNKWILGTGQPSLSELQAQRWRKMTFHLLMCKHKQKHVK